jgi:hypothetical protein
MRPLRICSRKDCANTAAALGTEMGAMSSMGAIIGTVIWPVNTNGQAKNPDFP